MQRRFTRGDSPRTIAHYAQGDTMGFNPKHRGNGYTEHGGFTRDACMSTDGAVSDMPGTYKAPPCRTPCTGRSANGYTEHGGFTRENCKRTDGGKR